MFSTAKIYLSNGNTIEVKYYTEDWEIFINEWYEQKHKIIAFENCSVFADNIIAIEFLEDRK